MDNDKQVVAAPAASAVHNEVQLFLRDELLPLAKQNTRNVYDLEAEYAKTKKNNSPFIPLVLLACFAVVGFGALLAVAQIRSRNGRIAVSLDVFEDVNLKNLIDTVTRTQDMYEQAVKNLSGLQGDYNARVNEAELKLSSDKDIIKSMKLSKSEANRRTQAVTATYKKTMASIHAEYDSQIATATKEVDEYKARLAEFDNAKVKSAQEKDKALDSERKLQNLERQKLTDNYEARIKKLEDSLNDVTKRSTKDKTDAVLSVVNKYNAEIEELNKTITEQTEQITTLDTQVTDLTNRCAVSEGISAGLTESLETVLKARGIEAVALNVMEGRVFLYVTRSKVSSIPASGAAASINYTPAGAKKSLEINGVIAQENGDFVFTASPDKDGNVMDVGGVPAGTTVTIK